MLAKSLSAQGPFVLDAVVRASRGKDRVNLGTEGPWRALMRLSEQLAAKSLHLTVRSPLSTVILLPRHQRRQESL